MQEKDIILKEYQEDSRHFCDFVNGVLAQGKPLVQCGQMVPVPTELVRIEEIPQKGKENRKSVRGVQRFRDLTRKLWRRTERLLLRFRIRRQLILECLSGL